MSEFKLIVSNEGAMILDEQGEAVDFQTASSLIDLLHQHYESPACVYIMRNTTTNEYKIGWTSQAIGRRISQVRYDVGDLGAIDLEFTIPTRSSLQARELEKKLHSHFADKHAYGEWYKLLDEDLDYFWDLWVIPSPEERVDVETLWFLYRRLQNMDPMQAKPQDREKVRFVLDQMRIVLVEFRQRLDQWEAELNETEHPARH